MKYNYETLDILSSKLAEIEEYAQNILKEIAATDKEQQTVGSDHQWAAIHLINELKATERAISKLKELL